MCLGVNDIVLHRDRLSVIHITYFHNIHYSYISTLHAYVYINPLVRLFQSCILIPCMHCPDNEREMYYAWKT